MTCSKCGADGAGACSCGAAYLPARERAVAAIVKNPDESDRAIAEEIGMPHATVSRARTAVVSNETTQKRIGKDGKSYPVERKVPANRAINAAPNVSTSR